MSDQEGHASDLEAENAELQAELERLRASADAARRARRYRIRKITAGVLVVLTSMAVVAATVGVWTRATAFETERYVDLVSPLAREPEVQEALAGYLTDQAVEALDIEARVTTALSSTEVLAEQADLLAAPIAEGARSLIHDQVIRILDSDAFQDLWVRLLTVSHEKVVALLRGDLEELPNIVIEEGEVRLNLIPVLAQVIRRVVEGGVALVAPDVTIPTIAPEELPEAARARLSTALGQPLPDDFGQVTILTEQRLAELQDAVRAFDRFVWLLVLGSVLLIAAAIAVSVSRRRTIIQLSLGIVAALFIGGIAIRRIRDELLAAISADGRQAAREVFAATLSDLRSVGLFLLWATLAVAVVAYVAGRPRWVVNSATSVRAALGERDLGPWAARHADALRVATLVMGALVLFLTGIGWVAVILVGAVVAGVFWALARLAAGRPDDGGSGETPSVVLDRPGSRR